MTLPARARDRVIVALDRPNVDDARRLVAELGDHATFYKIGLELVMAGGLEFARELKRDGKRVFLDMKLLDIPNTVERAVGNVAEMGLDMLTIHGHDAKTVAAAARGKGASTLKLLSVTVLTSLTASDLNEQGTRMDPASLVLHRAKLTLAAGGDGVVASGQEASALRAELPAGFLIVTPGIRLPGGAAGDQQRVTSPGDAMAAGADYIVVGRPITDAADPRAAADAFVGHVEDALVRRR